MTKLLSALNAFVWGAPALILIVGVGICLSIRLGFVQLRLFPRAIASFWRKLRPGGQKDGSFQALCTALGATVGTGNLAGVAGALCIGGPGAVFWMWVCGLLGMVTKYAEVVLAVQYRRRTDSGCLGGPMYVIEAGLGQRYLPLAKSYCVFALVAAFGVGNGTQVNAVITGIHGVLQQYGRTASWRLDLTIGIVLSVLTGVMLLGGAGRIASVAEKLVPFAAAGYILLCAGVLIAGNDRIGWAFSQILEGAFDPKAVTGGALGSAFQALRVGCSRGVFTNEAGMGTASIAHAQANVDHPAEQGLMGILEVFLDTEVICTLTALVILVSGVPVPYGTDVGAELAANAFCEVYGPSAQLLITGMLLCFAFATILGWGLYGARCAQYLMGDGGWGWFAFAQTCAVALSAVLDTAVVWQISELINGFMVIPNLLALAMLTPEVSRLTKEYIKIRQSSAGGGSYANFHQRESL